MKKNTTMVTMTMVTAIMVGMLTGCKAYQKVEADQVQPTMEVEETEEVVVEMYDSALETTEGLYTFNDMEKTMWTKVYVDTKDIPSENGNTVNTIVRGKSVKVTGQCIENGWYRLEDNTYVIGKDLSDTEISVSNKVEPTQEYLDTLAENKAKHEAEVQARFTKTTNQNSKPQPTTNNVAQPTQNVVQPTNNQPTQNVAQPTNTQPTVVEQPTQPAPQPEVQQPAPQPQPSQNTPILDENGNIPQDVIWEMLGANPDDFIQGDSSEHWRAYGEE